MNSGENISISTTNGRNSELAALKWPVTSCTKKNQVAGSYLSAPRGVVLSNRRRSFKNIQVCQLSKAAVHELLRKKHERLTKFDCACEAKKSLKEGTKSTKDAKGMQQSLSPKSRPTTAGHRILTLSLPQA